MKNYEELKRQFGSNNPPRSLFPLLWLHGCEEETEEVIRREIEKMDECGCGGFVIESRPHADYLGDNWWRDLRICLDEAEQRGMEVWIFDEEYFPSGIAGGKIVDKYPEYRMLVLTKEHIRWDPLKVPDIGTDWERVIGYIVCDWFPEQGVPGRRFEFISDSDELEARVSSDAFKGCEELALIVVGLKKSWSGRMADKMVDYLCSEVTDCFIELTYEETKRHFFSHFGGTIKGFFGDETSFENYASYNVLFGPDTPCFPWTRDLEKEFLNRKGYSLEDVYFHLWYELGEESRRARFDYMDVITSMFSENFFGRIQSWCHKNGVRFIGHVIEDNHAHMHHGYGVGHFFRATGSFDMGGYDIVLRQVDREQKREPFINHYPQFEWNNDFFQYTVAKLAQSAAHMTIDTDLVMCENFGAYGWNLGLRDMVWLTNWQTARGTNWYVPHAFSPLFPDPDCPPHFFAAGANPQWPYFRQWSNFANRSCLMLRGARYLSETAVLYPAESHWTGDQDQLDSVCKTLMEHQKDFSILPCDLLNDRDRCVIADGTIKINGMVFCAIVLPRLETLPEPVLEPLLAFVESGGLLMNVDSKLSATCRGDKNALERIERLNSGMVGISLQELPGRLRSGMQADMIANPGHHDFRCTQYWQEDAKIFFCSNESLTETIESRLFLPVRGIPEKWDPMTGDVTGALEFTPYKSGIEVRILLEPFQSYFIVVRLQDSINLPAESKIERPIYSSVKSLTEWSIIATSTTVPGDPLPDFAGCGLGDWSNWPEGERFSGTVVYECRWACESSDPSDRYVLDLGQVGEICRIKLNDGPWESRLCPPYRFILSGETLSSDNVLQVEVTNTLGARMRDDFSRDHPDVSGLIGPVTLSLERYAFNQNDGS